MSNKSKIVDLIEDYLRVSTHQRNIGQMAQDIVEMLRDKGLFKDE